MNLKRAPHRFLSHLVAFALLSSSMPAFSQEATAPAAPAKRLPALCDPDLGEGGSGGYGAPILKWPRYTDPPSQEYQAAAKAFLEDRTQKVYIDISKGHAAYPATTDKAKPDLSPSMAARKQFFDLSFASAVVAICDGKRQLAWHQKQFEEAKQKKSDEKETWGVADPIAAAVQVNACSDADKAMAQQYQKAQNTYSYYSKVIEKRLKGFTDQNNKPVMGLEDAFPKYRQENRANLDKWKSTIQTESAAKWNELETEFSLHWGTAKVHDGSPVDPNGFYSSFLLETRKEMEISKEHEKFFQENQTVFDKLKERCASFLDKTLTVKEPKSEAGDITGTSVNAATEERLKTGTTKSKIPGEREDPTITTSDDSPLTRTRNDDTGGTRQQTAGGPGNDTGGATSGLSGTHVVAGLVAAGVIGGGAYYLYKKNKKEKEARAQEEADSANFLAQLNAPKPIAPSTGGPITISPGGSAPAGSRLVITNPIGGASTGATIGPITVQVLDTNGISLSVNGLAVEASCLTPSPCSLTGGKNVTTVNGAATFDSLSFVQPDHGVQLQFTATGAGSAVMPATFDVSGSAPRQ